MADDAQKTEEPICRRDQAVALLLAGRSQGEIATELGISQQRVSQFLNQSALLRRAEHHTQVVNEIAQRFGYELMDIRHHPYWKAAHAR